MEGTNPHAHHRLRRHRPHGPAPDRRLDDSAAIAEAVRGSGAVLSTLGPSAKKADAPPLVVGYRHIVAAMHEHGVERLVVMGTPSIPDPSDGPKTASVNVGNVGDKDGIRNTQHATTSF